MNLIQQFSNFTNTKDNPDIIIIGISSDYHGKGDYYILHLGMPFKDLTITIDNIRISKSDGERILNAISNAEDLVKKINNETFETMVNPTNILDKKIEFEMDKKYFSARVQAYVKE